MSRAAYFALQPFLYLLMYLPVILGLGYLGFVGIGGIFVLASHAAPWVGAAVPLLLKAYLPLAGLTFVVLVVFGFRHCCLGNHRFAGHLLHEKPMGYLLDLLAAMTWPVSWGIRTWDMAMWGQNWLAIVFEPTVAWVDTVLHGMRMDVVDAEGTHTTSRIK